MSYGASNPMDDLTMKNPEDLYAFQATLLHLFGFDHYKLSKFFHGLNQKLAGVKESKIMKDILS